MYAAARCAGPNLIRWNACCLADMSVALVALGTAARISTPGQVHAARALGWNPRIVPGVGLWAVGQLGNLYHHYLLTLLRKPGETAYKVPRGGAFGLVCCPHYLFEIIGWIGFVLTLSHVAGAILLANMTSYLLGRAHCTLKWYEGKAAHDKLDAPLPSGWKRIIPFVF